MPLIFVHGVNNRAGDCDYFRDRGMRTTMFDRLVVQAGKRNYPAFAVLDEVYWGDLGVKYLWGLRSLPPTNVLASLGPETQAPTPMATASFELLELFDEFPPSSTRSAATPGLEILGVESSAGQLLSAARQAPARVIKAIIAPAKVEADPRPAVPGNAPELTSERRTQCEAEGRDRALLLIAADEAARSDEVAMKLRCAKDDEDVLAIIQQETSSRYQALGRLATGAVPAHPAAPPEGVETLGFGDMFAASTRRLTEVIDSVRGTMRRASQGTMRGASLVALKARRDSLTLSGGIFLGDVFEYFRRGQGGRERLGTIAQRVADKLQVASQAARKLGEPLVVVGHSFGGIITYDLFTSPFITTAPDFKDFKVDLWVTVGSQVGLFAEMKAYVGSPDGVPSDQTPTLGKPGVVEHWLNFYDAADIFSFLAEPVFGKDAVTDIELREGAHLGSAHGAYFSEPSFYRRLAEGLE